MLQRIKQSGLTNVDMSSHICCDEHRKQLLKFADLSQLIPHIDMANLAFYFARQCKYSKKAVRITRRSAVGTHRSSICSEKSTSPFHVVDRLITSPTGMYAEELTARPFQELCSRKDLISSFEHYSRSLTFEDYNIIPYVLDVKLKYRSIPFLTKQQIHNYLSCMRIISLRETKINRVHKGFVIPFCTIVDPFITPRCIQSIVQDEKGQAIRMAIYNWHTLLIDQSKEHIRSRLRTGRKFIVGNPFIKMAADGFLILRVDNPRLDMWFTDYEDEIEHMNAEKLRDLGNKCFENNDIHGAIEYYSLGLAKAPNDTRILNNRAECYLQSQLPRIALADCERILEIFKTNSTEDNTDITCTWKIHYRKIRALIGLQKYDEAKLAIYSLVESIQDASPICNDIIDRFRHILDIDIPRLENEAQGNFDMFELMSGRTKRLDEFYAEFERKNVYEFRQCEQPEKGYGVYALCHLQPGTLLMVEQPFVYVQSKSNDILIDSPSHVVEFSLTQTHESRNTDDDNGSASKYLRQSVLEFIREFEKRILMDPKQFVDKCSHLAPLRQHLSRKGTHDDNEYRLPYKTFLETLERNAIGCGLWPKLARFNHSCLPNCFYIIINRLCFLSVLKPIETGQELTICYLSTVYHSYIDRSVRLHDYYINECQCQLCDYDRNRGQAEMQQLLRLFEESDEDEQKRRYLFKHLLYQFGVDRPVGFIDQMSRLKRTVKIDIFMQQVRHGYLAHSFILKYIMSHKHKNDKIESIISELKQEFAYINWTDDSNECDTENTRFTQILQSFINLL